MLSRLFYLAIFVATYTPALAAPSNTKTFALTVDGYGKQFEEVDTADLVFSISTRNKEAQQAKNEHDATLESISSYLPENGYSEDKISLQSTLLYRNHAASPTPADDYYICRSVYSMRTMSLDRLSDLQANLVEMGVDEILGVTLFSSDRRQLEDVARKRAIEDAKQKAQFTCEELGWKLGKAVTINYGQLHWYSQQSAASFSPHGEHGNRGGRGGTSTAANIGASTYVDANVTLTFQYTIE